MSLLAEEAQDTESLEHYRTYLSMFKAVSPSGTKNK